MGIQRNSLADSSQYRVQCRLLALDSPRWYRLGSLDRHDRCFALPTNKSLVEHEGWVCMCLLVLRQINKSPSVLHVEFSIGLNVSCVFCAVQDNSGGGGVDLWHVYGTGEYDLSGRAAAINYHRAQHLVWSFPGCWVRMRLPQADCVAWLATWW